MQMEGYTHEGVRMQTNSSQSIIALRKRFIVAGAFIEILNIELEKYIYIYYSGIVLAIYYKSTRRIKPLLEYLYRSSMCCHLTNTNELVTPSIE